MTKARVRIISLSTIWLTILVVIFFDFTFWQKFKICWIGIMLTSGTLMLTHFHYKKWGPEIRDHLEKLDLRLINERPLTIFESMQFADTNYYFEFVSYNFKQILEVERDNSKKEICVRITKNYLTNTINNIEILGDV